MKMFKKLIRWLFRGLIKRYELSQIILYSTFRIEGNPNTVKKMIEFIKNNIVAIILIFLMIVLLIVQIKSCNSKPEFTQIDRDSLKSEIIKEINKKIEPINIKVNHIDSLLINQSWERNVYNLNLENKKIINGLTSGDSLQHLIMEELNK